MKILIIDDDATVNDLWSIAFKNAGFETISASMAQEGIDTAKTQQPDFILLDQIMPDMKGNDVLKMLKSDATTQKIPVALISNYSDKQLMQEAIQAGAIDYILKYQIEPQDLVDKVKNLLQESKNSQPTSS
jgi:DNA-binding response OmpR family regulator